MNPFDGIGGGKAAVLDYLDAEFTIIKPGEFVNCAITGKPIALEALKYWNVDKQEAYVNAAAAMEGFNVARSSK